MISFVFSSPRHHAEILLPVVRALQARGQPCRVISLAEFRGLETPAWNLGGASLHRLMPIKRPMKIPPPDATVERPTVNVRSLAQRIVWAAGVGPRLRWLLRGSRAVVVPNDSAFPYVQLVNSLRERHVPFVLVQEGIRFPLPSERASAYGTNGATRVCVWGKGSAEHFDRIGVPAHALSITGNPRFDQIDPAGFRAEGAKLLAELGVPSAPLLFLSNPIEAMGFSDLDGKLELFATFLREAQPVLASSNVPLVVKLHPYEDPEHFRAVARRLAIRVVVAADAPLFPLLATARAAVVTASTVGLEALLFGLPLAALEIPRHGYPFEYVQRDAALGLAPGSIARGLEQLLSHPDARGAAATEFVERHLAHRGTAGTHVSDTILEAVRA